MAETKMTLEAWRVSKVRTRARGVHAIRVELRYRVGAAVLTARVPWTALTASRLWGRAQKKLAAVFRNSSDVEAFPPGWRETFRGDFVAVCDYVVRTRRTYGSGAEVRQNA